MNVSDSGPKVDETPSDSDAVLLKIDDVCVQFESQWNAETAPSLVRNLVDEFQPEDLRPQLFRELVATDCELRSRIGSQPIPDQFIQQFPDYASAVTRAVAMWKESEFDSGHDGPSTTNEVPQSIGGYTIIREIGRGGGSVVYEAIQPDLQRKVALKTYALNPARFREQRQRFELEAKTASQLEHENIVSVYDSGEDDGVLFYVMQLVEGVNLHELIRARHDSPEDSQTAKASGTRRPSLMRSAQIIAQATMALEFAHQRGVLHRDVKPSNLMLDEEGTIRLTDFGLARVRDADNDLTDTGNIVGSLRYLPPEAFEGMRDERGDVYGLGLTLFELLTGQPAFAHKDRAELIRSICEYNVSSPRQIDGSVPLDLDTITMKAIARDPGDRYSSAREFGDDLQRFLAGKPIHARPVSTIERAWKWSRRHPGPAWLATVLAAVLLVGIPAYVFMWRGRELDRVLADKKLADAALQQEQSANAAREASAIADQAKARAAGAAEARADAEYALLISGAQSAVESGEYANAVERLYQYEDDLQRKIDVGEAVKDRRDWEWDYLHGLLDEATITIPATEATISAVRLSPVEDCFVTVGQGWGVHSNQVFSGVVRLRNASTGETIRTFAAGDEAFCDAAFSSDGTQLATISLHDSSRSLTGWVRVWDVASGELLRSRKLTDDYPLEELSRVGSVKRFLPQIQYGPQGKLLVTSSPVIAFDAQTLEPKWRQQGQRAFVVSESVVIRKGQLRLHDLETGEPKGKGQSGYIPLDISEHADHSQILMVGRAGNAVLFHRLEESRISQFKNIAIPKTFFTTFTPNGEHILRSETGGDIVIQEPAKDGRELDRLVGHQSPVVSGAFNRSGRRLITADRDGVIKIWDVGTSRNRLTIDIPNTFGTAAESIAFDLGNRLHYSGSSFDEKRMPKSAGMVKSDGSGFEAYEIATTRCIFWPRHDITYSPDGGMLAAPAKEEQAPDDRQELLGYSGSDRIHIWSTDTQEIQRTIKLDRPGWITAIGWSPEAKRLAVGTVSLTGESSHVALISLDDNPDSSIHWRSAGPGVATCLAFVPDGRQLAAGYGGGGVALIPTDSDDDVELLRNVDDPGGLPSCVDVDVTGQRLAVATIGDPILRIFDLTKQELAHEVSLTADVSSVRFSPNGQRLVVANQQSIVHLLSASSGHPLLTLDGRSNIRQPTPGTSIKAVFSPDGRRIAAAGLQGRITIWDAVENP